MQEAFDALGKGDVWGALERALGAALAGFYALIPVYAISIVLLTVAVRLLLWPLVSRQTKSMLAMQKVQPEIRKIQQKFKGDRQKLNEELMKFYQENRINPLASCLPLLVQAPILFALFRVLTPPHGGSFLSEAGRVAIGGAPTCEGLVPRGVHGLIPSTSALRRALDCTSQTFLGMDLAKRPADFFWIFPDVIPYLFLVAAVLVTGIVSQRQMAKRTPATAMNDQMRIVTKIMPILFGFFTISFSAGLGVYFAVGNLWQLGQQEMIFRQRQRLEEAERAAARDAKKSGAPPPPPPRRRSLLAALAGQRAAPQEEPGATPRRSETDGKAEDAQPVVEGNGQRERKPRTPAPSSASAPPRPTAKGTGGGSRPAAKKRRKKRGR